MEQKIQEIQNELKIAIQETEEEYAAKNILNSQLNDFRQEYAQKQEET